MNRPDDHLTERGKALDAADVIAQGVRKAETFRFSLKVIADGLRSETIWHRRGYYDAADLRAWADSLDARHDHADPCEDEACPCYKAALDHERDQGRGPR